MSEAGDNEAAPCIVHFVSLDENLYAAFRSVSREKAELARQMLTEVFGHDRVSITSFGESDLDEYRETVALWAADPRIRNRPD
jgi:hypothetical protein